MDQPRLSVVIPLHDDAGIVGECLASVRAALDASFPGAYELVFVDDGSADGTAAALLSRAENDPRVKLVELDRNYGQHAALCAGLEASSGDVIVTLDSDLQIGPEAIPLLAAKLAEGHDLVSGVRLGRTDSLFLRTLPSRLFNLLVVRMTGVRLRDWGCPAVALSRPLATQVLRYGEMRRFLKPLGVMLARSTAEVELRHRPRIGGRSGYSFADLFELALDFVTNFSRRPFQKVSLAGTALVAFGLVTGAVYTLLRLLLGVLPGNRVQALVFLSLVLGLQLAVLGFLGEFIIRIYRRQNNLPFYTVRAVRGGKGGT